MLSLICLAASLASSAAPPVEVPIPKGRHLFAMNGWRVVNHATLVPETRHHRAQSFNHRYYVGKVGSDSGRLVFACRDTHGGPRVLTVRADGTVLLDVYPSRLVWVGPGDAVAHFGDGKPLRLPGVDGDVRLLHANDFGVVVVEPQLNTTVKVYFVPLSGRDPVLAKLVALAERESSSIYYTRTGFHVNERWVVWGGREIGLPYTKPLRGPVMAVDGKTLARWKLPVPEDAAILGVEGNLAVIRHGKPPAGEREGQLEAFDLAARKRLTTYSSSGDTRLLAIRDGIGYFTLPLPNVVGKKAGRREVVALDLLRKADALARQEVPPATYHEQVMATAKGLQLMCEPLTVVPWAKRP